MLPHQLADLAPAAARTCLSVERFCRQLGAPQDGQHLLLALSGGADSTALAILLSLLAPRRRWQLTACTVNHGLRADAADDVRFVQRLCARLALPCHCVHADVAALARQQKRGTEDAARTARYALLEEVRRRTNCQWILTGHQREDLCEDQLMRLIRGTGWPALGGMSARDDQRHLLRPLLMLSGRRLRQLLQEWHVSWQEDASNADMRFLRNRIRHQLLPRLEEENPAYGQAAGQLWQLARCDADYWDATVEAVLALHPWHQQGDAITLPRSLLASQPQAVRLRCYLRAIRHLSRQHGGQARAERLLALDRAWQEGRGGTCFQFPGGLEAVLRQGAVTLRPAVPRPAPPSLKK